jgi:hypothetical protein
MYDMSNQKSELANQIMEAMQEASDRGPLKKKPEKNAAYRYGHALSP